MKRRYRSELFFRITAVIAAAVIGTACSNSSNQTNTLTHTISTSLGQIQGVQRYGTVNEYRGIPYAQRLTSQDRWALAKPVSAWNGTLNATEFGAACPQQARFDLTEESNVEDCLSLNITTPIASNSNQKLPVMVWIPGGGFVGGSSNLYRLDKLAHEGQIIVVSMNYRVGALGFMPHPSIGGGWNGNLGLEDQRLALQWIQDHIESFGGDKTKITLSGESAGAASTCLHVLSKTKTEGLFHQAAPLSYNCLYEWPTLDSALRQSNIAISGPRTPIYQRMADELNCIEPSGSYAQLECMRQKPISDVLAAQGRVGKIVPLFPFAPVIKSGANGTIPLPGYSAASLRENVYRIPILYGGAKDELRLYVAYDTIANPTVDTSNLPANFRDGELFKYYLLDPVPPAGGWQAKFMDIISTYFGANPISADMLGSMFSDYTPVVGLNNCSYLRTAKALSGIMPVYQWEFADANALVLGVGIAKGQNPRMALGPVHSAALNYFFPNLSNTAAIDAPNLPADSQLLSNDMVQMWTHFVKTGTPRSSNLGNWPRFDASTSNHNVMQFVPKQIRLIDATANHQCDFWEGIDSKLNPIDLKP